MRKSYQEENTTMTLIKSLMMGLAVSAFSVASFFMTPATAADTDVLPTASDDIEFYRTASGWIVYKNVTRESCFATKKDDTQAIQMGLTKDKNVGYLGGFSTEYVPDNGAQFVEFEVDGRPFTGTAVDVSRSLNEGFKGAYVLVNNPNFVDSVRYSYEMAVHLEKSTNVIMNTSGAYYAMYEAEQCMTGF